MVRPNAVVNDAPFKKHRSLDRSDSCKTTETSQDSREPSRDSPSKDSTWSQKDSGKANVKNLKKSKTIFIQRSTLETVIHRRHAERSGCISIPFTVALFCFSTLSISYHEDIRKLFLIESSLRNLFEEYKNYEDRLTLNHIAHADQVWEWMFHTLVPAAFTQKDPLGHVLPQDQWSAILGRNMMRGGVLLEQFRRPGSPPIGNPSLLSNSSEFPISFPGEGLLPRPQTPAGKDLMGRRLRSGKSSGGPEGTEANIHPAGPAGDPENSFPFMLFEQESQDVVISRLKYLQKSKWIDKGTQQIAIKMTLINEDESDSDLTVVTRLVIRLTFPDEGGVYSAIRIQSSFAKAWREWITVLSDICVLILLIRLTWIEFFEVHRHWKESKTTKYFQDFWNCLDWATIVLGWLIAGMFVNERFNNVKLFEALDTVSSQETDADYWGRMLELHYRADTLRWVNMWLRLLMGYWILVILCRFFKAFRGQPRLAVVTTTITYAAAELVHFGIIFLCIFCTFAFSGLILFGRRVAGFSTIRNAIGTSFAIACGEFDWALLSQQNYWTACLWFWTFMLLVFLIMLNMVLAIVMDCYTTARVNSVEGEPIWKSTAALLWRMKKKLKKRLQAMKGGPVDKKGKPDHLYENELLEHMDDLGHKITLEKLQATVPGISQKQANAIFKDAESIEHHQGSKNHTIADCMKYVTRIDRKVKELMLHVVENSDASDRCIVKKFRRAKIRRVIIDALWDGRLHKAMKTLDCAITKDHIAQNEIKRKIAKADAILAAKQKALPEASVVDMPELTFEANKSNSIEGKEQAEQIAGLRSDVETLLRASNQPSVDMGDMDGLNKLHSLQIAMSKHICEMHSMIMHQQSGHVVHQPHKSAGPDGRPALLDRQPSLPDRQPSLSNQPIQPIEPVHHRARQEQLPPSGICDPDWLPAGAAPCSGVMDYFAPGRSISPVPHPLENSYGASEEAEAPRPIPNAEACHMHGSYVPQEFHVQENLHASHVPKGACMARKGPVPGASTEMYNVQMSPHLHSGHRHVKDGKVHKVTEGSVPVDNAEMCPLHGLYVPQELLPQEHPHTSHVSRGAYKGTEGPVPIANAEMRHMSPRLPSSHRHVMNGRPYRVTDGHGPVPNAEMHRMSTRSHSGQRHVKNRKAYPMTEGPGPVANAEMYHKSPRLRSVERRGIAPAAYYHGGGEYYASSGAHPAQGMPSNIWSPDMAYQALSPNPHQEEIRGHRAPSPNPQHITSTRNVSSAPRRYDGSIPVPYTMNRSQNGIMEVPGRANGEFDYEEA